MGINIELKQITPTKDWQIKVWEVYSGKFYLGSITKRKAGRGTALRYKNKETFIVYQCHIKLFSAENLGYRQKNIIKITDLKLAKAEFVRLYSKLIDNLTKDNDD